MFISHQFSMLEMDRDFWEAMGCTIGDEFGNASPWDINRMLCNA